MRDFDELSDQGQLRRLRRCSAVLLQQYGISDPKLTLLAHHRQTTFKVESQTTGEKYVLRYHRPKYRPSTIVRSELRWLQSLRENTELVVPQPLATLNGEHVPAVTGEGLPSDLHCSMTRWGEGKRYFRQKGPGARVLREVGRMMATMHRHAEDFVPPEDFDCPTWDWKRLFQKSSAEAGDAEWRMLDAEGRRLFRETGREVRSAMEAIGTGRDVFGVIHGDLIQANYVIHRGEVRVIDFADFGYGHFLYDMGITLFGLWGLDDDQRQRRAFLTGYREVRAFSAEHERLLDLFIAARAVVQARFVMGSQYPADQRMALKYVQKVVNGLRLWLSAGRNFNR